MSYNPNCIFQAAIDFLPILLPRIFADSERISADGRHFDNGEFVSAKTGLWWADDETVLGTFLDCAADKLNKPVSAISDRVAEIVRFDPACQCLSPQICECGHSVESADWQEVWSTSHPQQGTIGETYIRSLGVDCKLSKDIRFLAKGVGKNSFGHDAIVSKLESADGALAGVQVTLLHENGSQVADIQKPRLTYSDQAESALCIGKPTSSWLVAECLEEGLAAHCLYGDPVFVCFGLARVERFVAANWRDLRNLKLLHSDQITEKVAEKAMRKHRIGSVGPDAPSFVSQLQALNGAQI